MANPTVTKPTQFGAAPDAFYESFSLTNGLRVLEREVMRFDASGNAIGTKTTSVLQQAWEGSLGTIRWEDVPVVTVP